MERQSLTCLHTHTHYCDGKGTVEEYCAAAAAQGLSAIGFSAHAPLGMKTSWHLQAERFGEYAAAVNAAKKKWAGRLTVYLGLEADYIEGITSPAFWDKEKYGLDYVIGSVHYIPTPQGSLVEVDGSGESFRNLVHGSFAGDALAVVRAYYGCVEKMVRNGGFDILGHFDLVKKNNQNDAFFSLEDPAYREAAANAVRVVNQARQTNDFAIEVNTGALARKTYPDTYPSAAILRLLAGPLFIITTDAHCPEHLGIGYDKAAANLRAAGYRASAFFEGRAADGKSRWSLSPLA
jgi:histidinol-phosphatase (PHP family)